MRQIKVKQLTQESFSVYGTFANLTSPQGPYLEMRDGKARFYRDIIFLNTGGQTTATLSVTQAFQIENKIDAIEMHSKSTECILPLDGDVIIHVAPATANGDMPVDRIEAFLIPKGTVVILNRAVWHGAPFAVGRETVNSLISLPERAYAEDCFVYAIPEQDQAVIVTD
ncbi:hypothetical protein AGMMS50276_22100 [Synergistales bacterium]|nr:hypothetical protein AGMMS50276_22100 [Synergistales bacterium]